MICKIMQKFEKTMTIGGKVSRVHHRGVLALNVAAVSESEAEDSEILIRRHSHSLGVSYGFFGTFCMKTCTNLQITFSLTRN